MRVSRWLLFGLVGLASFMLLAQEEISDADEVSPEASIEEQEAPPAAPVEQQADPVNTPVVSGEFQVFNPSEDISEDLSVPFPVDI